MLKRALLRLPLRLRQLPPAAPRQCDFISPSSCLTTRRTYATPGRPKSVVGEPSRPVKRAVKKKAKEPAAKKPVGAKKPKAPKKAAKTLTPEQKAAKKEKAQVAKNKLKLQALKKTALEPPPKAKASAWQEFTAEKMPVKFKEAASSTADGPMAQNRAAAAAMNATAAEWKQLSAAEHEHYNHLAVQKRQAQAAEYKRWVESHSPEEIFHANQARSQLRTKQKQGVKGIGKVGKWAKIIDERAVKRPLTGFTQFSSSRHASGDFKNIALPERAKLIAQEWKELNGTEKRKYDHLSDQDRDRYATEFKHTYGYEAPLTRSPVAAAA